MLTLNILPLKLKKRISWKYIYKSLRMLVYVLLIIVILYSIVFLVLELVLQMHFVETVQETTVITRSTENYTKQADGLNKEINNIYSIQKDIVLWSYLVQYFGQNQVQGIALNSLSADKDKGELRLKGQAEDRDSLLEFKQFLENTEFLHRVNLPFDSLLKKQNIDFEIKAKFKSYEFTSGQKASA